jgi:diguanylate cyclase
MTGKAEKTHRIGEIALGALKETGLPSPPQNYELWYTHVEGRNPSLSRDIQIALDPSGKMDPKDAFELYKKHIQHADLSRDVIDLMSRFRDEVTDLYDVIEKTGKSTHGHTETLSGLSDQLRHTTEEYPAVGALLEGVISVAKDMQLQNEQLEARLADSTSEINALQRNVESVQAEALKDPLTGIANRAKFDQFLEEQMAAAGPAGEPLTLVMADVDHFKKFNDKWGHTTGDQVLRLVAEVMNANVKGKDLLARYGGEEFAIILPDTSVKNAQMLADRIRKAIESRHLKKRRTDEDLGVITMSMGVAKFTPTDTMDGFIERADICLYAAKDAGRNRVFSENDVAAMENEEAQNNKQAGAA